MALRNTSERYEYIYGNNARKLEKDTADSIKGKAEHKKSHASKPKYVEEERHSTRANTKTTERIQKNRARFLAFDWKYTVVVLSACYSTVECYGEAGHRLKDREDSIAQ